MTTTPCCSRRPHSISLKARRLYTTTPNCHRWRGTLSSRSFPARSTSSETCPAACHTPSVPRFPCPHRGDSRPEAESVSLNSPKWNSTCHIQSSPPHHSGTARNMSRSRYIRHYPAQSKTRPYAEAPHQPTVVPYKNVPAHRAAAQPPTKARPMQANISITPFFSYAIL